MALFAALKLAGLRSGAESGAIFVMAFAETKLAGRRSGDCARCCFFMDPRLDTRWGVPFIIEAFCRGPLVVREGFLIGLRLLRSSLERSEEVSLTVVRTPFIKDAFCRGPL